MSIYVIYQCSICRRFKTLQKDDLRTVPTNCTITKGCQGSLSQTGETSTNTPTAPVAGLVDWYPRVQTVIPAAQPAPLPILIPLATTPSVQLTVALLLTDAQAAANPDLSLNLVRQVTGSFASQQFMFISNTSTLVSGRDANGKNLRFDQAAINSARVSVVVNGVTLPIGTHAGQITLTPNLVSLATLPPAGSQIIITVFAAPQTSPFSLALTANFTTIGGPGSWGSVKWVNQLIVNNSQLTNNLLQKWWLYTSQSIDLPIGTQLSLAGIGLQGQAGSLIPGTLGDLTSLAFFLAQPPFDGVDRVLTSFLLGSAITQNAISISNLGAVVDSLLVSTSFPPLSLTPNSIPISSSFTAPDVFPTADGIALDSITTVPLPSTIIGPV